MRGFSAGGFAKVFGRNRAYRATAALALLAAAGSASSEQAFAENPPDALGGQSGLLALAALALALLAAAIVAHVVLRRKWRGRIRELERGIGRKTASLDRALAMLSGEPQIIVSWDRPGAPPTVEGDFALVGDVAPGGRVLAYDTWLEPKAARRLEEGVERLLERGEAFSLLLSDRRGAHLEIAGGPVSGSAVVRIRDVSGDRLKLAELAKEFAQADEALKALRMALEAAKLPAWTRDEGGRLVWCNMAYARSVDAPGDAAAAEGQLELLEPPTRDEARKAIAGAGVWKARAPAVVGGERRTFEVTEVRAPSGSAGLAKDVSEAATLSAELKRNEEDLSRLMDRLSTAVAVFDKAKRLSFSNAAYRQIFSLDPAFLDQRPTDGEVLDRLRAQRQLPEQVNFREWKAEQLKAYQALEQSETVWHLPDGRAVRVVVSPNPKGGVTYLYDDATQSYALASQVSALTQVQGETLDALKEGVAVFGGDGRMKLFNPVFRQMWRIDPAKLRDRPHIDKIAEAARALCQDAAQWDALRAAVVGLSERRESRSVRIARRDGMTLDCAALPLPDGATLLTSHDVTAGANIERALTERNQALIAAEKLRNDFVNHVSYELRTPLTNIIGFTQLLAAGGVGPLNPKQLEYAGFITSSSHALLTIIDDILDLASIDAGALELRLEAVDVADAMRAAAAGVHDRLDEAAIEMRMVMTDGVGAFRADGRRVRQVLFNLLSNAINYSEPGQTVTLAAMRRGSEIVFKVSDRGRGIPPEMIDRVFERFETYPNGSRHRGPGLGLSIVKALVELHSGRVLIDTAANEGTTVTCIFPIDPSAAARPLGEGRSPAAETEPRPARRT